MPQPPLPQVPGHRRGAMAGGPGRRPARRRRTSTSSSRSRAALGPLALHNPRVVYGLLFRAAAETLLEVAADPKHLGAEIGFLAVLHTWGQNLELHPTSIASSPAAGCRPTARRWVACRPGFFLPVRVLSRVFRGKFLAGLRPPSTRGGSASRASWRRWPSPERFDRLLSEAVADRLGRVCQAAVRRPRGGPEVPGPVHPPGGHQQPPAGRSWTAARCSFRWKDYAQAGGSGR